MNGIRLRKVAIGCALALGGVSPLAAQQGDDVPPGVYAHTIENETYLQKGSQQIDVSEGEAAFADPDELSKLDVIPSFITNDRTPAPGFTDALQGCGVLAGTSPPVSDQPLQSDFERFDRQILDEIDMFLSLGYAPASVLMHAASMGVSIDRSLYAAVRSQPDRAEEFYMAALELMAYLPGWTCHADLDGGMYDPVYDVNDLPAQRLVRDVAERYFGDRSRLAQFPDWPHDEFHMLASTEELLNLVSQEDVEFWYRAGPRQDGPGANPRDGVLIALYPEEREEGEENGNGEEGSQAASGQIVIDTTAERIRKWRDEGRERVPVTFFYNFDYQRPVSGFGGDATLEQIMEAFFDEGEELTPVPLFTVGDYHLEVDGQELLELFEIPESDEIEQARYQALADDLAANGFSKKPVLASLLRSGRYSRLSNPERVRVALDQGVQRFPVALFYHRLDREACGAPAGCFEQMCGALVCAGADPNVCLEPAAAGAVRDSSFQVPTGGGGGSPPPPPPPASPS